ncbi:hypothetical protein C900_04182 [Fulvivirga imtechensis AK7]|uniref:Uncharacterized protein n=1 Tax=Fulvivirga imtechensis AK7 TaxID=1237149 RepID=L8JX22_9BACT|nr:hypothetical protein [Fulvivirga imtechensis]ELR73330.1 hypothetical protein C900_04182 [Fulvivirga imtechensis AK7]
MVEVFKTNVTKRHHADLLLDEIHAICTDYQANFDLDDCDHILRVVCCEGPVKVSFVAALLQKHGFEAEVLCDEPVSFGTWYSK